MELNPLGCGVQRWGCRMKQKSSPKPLKKKNASAPLLVCGLLFLFAGFELMLQYNKANALHLLSEDAMIEIRSPQTREEFKAYYDLRYRILREPWGLPRGTEKDDYEPISQHFMAVDTETGEILGVVKLFEKEPGVGWFSHLAVAGKAQRKGIGKMLMQAVEQAARQRGFKVLGCQARLNTTDYFKKLGFQIAGLPTQYFGTTQVVWMEKKLD